MSSEPSPTQTQSQAEYRAWLGKLKNRFRQVQLKAAVAVNTALLQFYWELGADIVARQAQADWGSCFLKQLSADLMGEFPEVKGFSASNLKYICQWYMFYAASPVIGQQPVAQLVKRPVAQILSISWGHNLAIITKPVGRVSPSGVTRQFAAAVAERGVGLRCAKTRFTRLDQLICQKLGGLGYEF